MAPGRLALLGAGGIYSAATSSKGWNHPPFEIPRHVYDGWDARKSGAALQTAWDSRFAAYAKQHPELAAAFKRRMAGELPANGARVLLVDPDKCVGCRMCALACPFGNIEVLDRGHAEKCDLCGGDPMCVQFCPRGALRCGPTVSVEAEKRDRWARALADTYRESE